MSSRSSFASDRRIREDHRRVHDRAPEEESPHAVGDRAFESTIFRRAMIQAANRSRRVPLVRPLRIERHARGTDAASRASSGLRRQIRAAYPSFPLSSIPITEDGLAQSRRPSPRSRFVSTLRRDGRGIGRAVHSLAEERTDGPARQLVLIESRSLRTAAVMKLVCGLPVQSPGRQLCPGPSR